MMTVTPDSKNDDGNDDQVPRHQEKKQIEHQEKDKHPFSTVKNGGLIDSALNTQNLAKNLSAIASTQRITMPESVLKASQVTSMLAEQNKHVLEAIKPIIESKAMLQNLITPINSDILKSFGTVMPKLDVLSGILTKSAYFGLGEELTTITQQYAVQQAEWLKGIVPFIDQLKSSYYPSNLQAIPDLDLNDVDKVVMLDGIALYEVPRTPIAAKLIKAPSNSTRRTIIGRKWREIAVDCRNILQSCKSSELSLAAKFADDAIQALETGNVASAQALTGSLIDTILRKYLPNTRPLILPSGKNKNTDHYLEFSVNKYIALAPIWQAYHSYKPDRKDTIPWTFNRHATAHIVSRRQDSRRNTVQGLMLLCGMLKFIDDAVLR